MHNTFNITFNKKFLPQHIGPQTDGEADNLVHYKKGVKVKSIM